MLRAVVLGSIYIFTLGAMPPLIRFLKRLGVVDRPTHRALHAKAVPRGAGILLIPVFAIGLVFMQIDFWVLWFVPIGFGVVGILDDVKRQTPLPRLLLQFAVAATGCFGLIRGFDTTLAYSLLLVVLLVAIVNAVNFMDGANGMVALSAGILGITYAVLFAKIGDWPMIGYALVLTAMVFGFLPWNMPRARIFLGDSGSYLIGGIIGVVVVYLLLSGETLAALFPLATYGLDTLWTLLKRLWARRSPFEAHREHAYQRLIVAGWAHWQASMLTAVFVAISGILAVLVLGQTWPNTGLLTALVLLVNTVYLLIPRLWSWRSPKENRPMGKN